MPKTWRRRSRFQSAKFRPYALAIGQMNLAWNEFHQALGTLFMLIVAEISPTDDEMAKTRGRLLLRLQIMWGHMSNDRQKRLLIEELAEWLGRERHAAYPTLCDDLQFLARRGHSLEDKRNNVIHAPFDEMINALAGGLARIPYGEIVAAALNARGRKLEGPAKRAGPQLLAAIRHYRDYAVALTHYAREIRDAFNARERGRRRAWPRRPLLPRLKDED